MPDLLSRRQALAALTGGAAATLLAPTVAAAASGSGSSGSGSGSSGGGFATGDRQPLFDFNDDFYRRNGVDPAGLTGRRNGTPPASTVDRAIDARYRDVRVLRHVPAYDHSGGERFFAILADLTPTGFTNDAAGRAARALAESSAVWVFPRLGSDPTSLGTNRQADMIDLRNGYFSNNPLALWVHVFVNWTAAAQSVGARRTLDDLARRNGVALDGLPIIRTRGEIDDLTSRGYVSQVRRPETQNGRWFVCPVFKDPRDGAIRPDATLATVRRPDGTALPAEQHFVDDFASLQRTGDWAD